MIQARDHGYASTSLRTRLLSHLSPFLGPSNRRPDSPDLAARLLDKALPQSRRVRRHLDLMLANSVKQRQLDARYRHAL